MTQKKGREERGQCERKEERIGVRAMKGREKRGVSVRDRKREEPIQVNLLG